MRDNRVWISLVSILLLAVGNVMGAGQLSDAYLNRIVSNYRNYESFQLSPSMTTEIDQMEVGASIISLSKLDVVHTNAYFYVPIHLKWTLGFGFYTPGMVTQNVINENGEKQPQTFQVGERIITVNGSYRFSQFSIGANINYDGRKDVNYNVPDDVNSGVKTINNNLTGVDLGVTYYPFEKESIGDLELGLTAQNLTGPVFKLYGTNEAGVPNVIFNYRYCGLQRNLTVSGDVSYGSLKELGMSFDAFYKLPQYLGFGLGYVKDYYDPNFVYLSSELRLQYLLNRLTRIKFDVGSAVDKITDVSFVYKIGISAKLYKTREERYAERLYNLAKIAPNNAYNEALKLYKEKKYWLATFKFGYVVSKYPRFYKVDAATYYLASSYEKLQMQDVAKTVYKQGQAKYKTSDYQAKYLFGLENIAYKNKNYSEALNYYNLVEKHPNDTDAVNGARYVAANIAFDQGQYANVISMTSKINNKSSYYLFAKYTEAIAYAQNNNANAALKSLFEITNYPYDKTDIAIVELVNKANILTGHVNQDLAKTEHNPKKLKIAFESYSKVPKTSMYYDETLVGLSWALLKIQQFDKAGFFVSELLSMKETPYRAEAYLLNGYVQTLKVKYDAAIKSLKKAQELASKGLSDAELKDSKSKYDDLNRKFADFGSKSLKLALTRTKTGREEKINGLTSKYKELVGTLGDEESNVLKLKKLDRFTKTNYKFILDEASFSLGTVQTLQIQKEKDDLLNKQKADEEKERLKMEELDKEMNQVK